MRKFPEKKDFSPLKTLTGSIVECPSQNNYYDCGIYLLQNVESFFTVILNLFCLISHFKINKVFFLLSRNL